EIPPAKALVPRHHFYEQILYVLAGRGHTLVGAGRGNRVDWGEGSLFSVPVNATYRHFNDDPAHPARLLAITTFPFTMQVFGSLGLVDNLTYELKERYNGEPDYFTRRERVRKRWDKTNFVRDLREAEVVLWEERGKGNASMFWEMAGNTI